MVLTAFVLLSKRCRLLFLVISSLVSCRLIRHLSATHCFPIRLAWILLFFSVLREKAKTSCPINNELMDLFFLIIANFPFNLRWQHSVAKQVVNPVLVIEKFCVVHHCLEKGRSRAVASASCSAYFIWAFWLQLDGGWRASELALSPEWSIRVGVPGPWSLGDISQAALQEGCGKVHSDLDFGKAT